MVSLTLSRTPSVLSSRSQNSTVHVSPSPSSSNFSSASSSSSSSNIDEENVTITASNRSLLKRKGKEKSHEDLQLLAISTRITELSYIISDIQTRIFEIQELRHKSHFSNESRSTGEIDQSLSQLDTRLETVTSGVKSINESLAPLMNQHVAKQLSDDGSPSEETVILRKRAAMIAEWDSLQKEIQILREELKEDKWLTVFRTVTDQADGMMSSLEKAVNRCQEFIWQVQRRNLDDTFSRSSSTSSVRSEKSPLSYDTFQALLDSFEAKKKHYMPATTKVLSIIDKGVQDRVTKNGECLRRHAESTQRWRNLKERIARTESEMESVRRMFVNGDVSTDNQASANSSEAGSSTSGATSKSKMLGSPPSETRKDSPFRRFARKFTGSKSPTPATPAVAPNSPQRIPSSEPVRTLRHRASMMHFLGSQPQTPVTPSHKHSHSLTPESSPSSKKLERLEAAAAMSMNSTLKNRPAWNSSTKVESEDKGATLKYSPRRPSISSSGVYRSSDEVPPVPPLYNRSVSRSSMASSRPWSPVTSSVSTAQSSNTPFSMYRPPSRSRAQTPGLPAMYRPSSRSQARTPSGLPLASLPTIPRTRPKTPSHIPAPSSHWRSMSQSPSDEWTDHSTSPQRAFSPTARSHTPGGSAMPARPPSRSMIPIPSVHVSSASRPSSAMSQYRPESSMSYTSRARTPAVSRPSVSTARLPPSSFRDSPAASPRTPGSVSRPPSRSGATTPSGEREGNGRPVHEFVPTSPRDPLEAEIAKVVNSLAHNLVIERVDPPLRGTSKEGEEIRAKFAFAGPLTKKVVTCKLTTLARADAKGTTKKVMCRVGGGWQDLHVFVLSRQT